MGVPDSFFEMVPEIWNKSKDFKITSDIICSHAITNNLAERHVTLTQEMTRSGPFKNEE